MSSSTIAPERPAGSVAGSFAGFPPEGLGFLAGLRADNTKAYFDAHRSIYESALREPAKAFVIALGDELRARVSPAIRAEPRVDGSILRMNRDIRFSQDADRYRDHLHLVLWEGEGHSREHPCFSMRVFPERVVLGAGLARLERGPLAAYRAAVLRDGDGRALEAAVAATARRGVALAAPAYKRVPRGIDPDHPRAALLRQGGVVVSGEWDLPQEVSSERFVSWVAERLEAMAPVERWLTRALS